MLPRNPNNSTVNYNQINHYSGMDNLVLGNIYNINMNGIVSKDKTPTNNIQINTTEDIHVNKNINEMSKSKLPLDEEAIDIISTHFGRSWKAFAREISFSEGQIDQFWEDNYVRGIKEVVYQMLLEWKRSKSPTFGKTVKVLWKRGNKEIVKILETEYWLTKKDSLGIENGQEVANAS